ncbi:hypothetical protein GCM10017557_26930 [Streptomyces aurantiacus]|uniref:Uncharacterized protein n=1 Tax=Streptomyces aurantiacus TaxID=47760 RepID=A0A7G1P1Z8_9ACTN|nr:hypothetical protein GCM10017557_26930 [Streptomyces aurantiacus]
MTGGRVVFRPRRPYPSRAFWGLRPQTPYRPERPRPQTPDGLKDGGPGKDAWTLEKGFALVGGVT